MVIACSPWSPWWRSSHWSIAVILGSVLGFIEIKKSSCLPTLPTEEGRLGERERGREGEREGGREGEGGRGRDREREGGRGRDREREGGKEGGREEGKGMEREGEGARGDSHGFAGVSACYIFLTHCVVCPQMRAYRTPPQPQATSRWVVGEEGGRRLSGPADGTHVQRAVGEISIKN